MNSHTSQTSQTSQITPILLLLLGATLLTSGCYQRVVKDKLGTYNGEIHEANLPDDSRGFWVETFDTEVVEVPSTEANDLRRESRQIYNEQLEDLGLEYKSRDD